MINDEVKNSLAYKLLSGLIRVFTLLPFAVAVQLGSAAGFCAYFFLKRRRASAYADLKSAFGNRFDEKQRRQLVQRHFAHLGQVGVEMLYFPQLKLEDLKPRLKINHKERHDRIIAENKPMVLLTAHFGNWEILQVIGTLEGRPIHVLQRPQKRALIGRILSDLRESRGSFAISRGMGVRDLIRALRANQSIGLLADQDAGKLEGQIEKLFNRKTTVPTGPFELAARTNAVLLPVFIVSRPGGQHEIFVEEPIACVEKPGEGYHFAMRRYLDLLESFASRYPEQWLWGAKRWKYSWTKRLVILSDGKPGHVKQSEAVAERFKKVDRQYGRPGMEYPTQTLRVEYLSAWHRKVFAGFSVFFIPFAQGRLAWLKLFFKPETAAALRQVSADFFISSGSSMTPLNLCMARECRAKSIVLMKPFWPFNYYRYDLALVPAHDRGPMPRETFRTLLVPSLSDHDRLEQAGKKFGKSLRAASRVRMAVFLGGPTRHYRMSLASMEKVIQAIESASGLLGDYLVTTSRRTPEGIVRFLKELRSDLKGCQELVVASEDSRPEVVPGMMKLAEILVITEDSISMISEAVASAKKVVVLGLATETLPAKHRRFLQLLLEKSAIVMAGTDDLESVLQKLEAAYQPALAREQDEALVKKLEAIL